MKTLGEIINDVKDGKKPNYEDLRYTVVALSALHHFAFNSILELARREKEGKYKPSLFGLEWHAKERFDNFQAALKLPLKQYVGTSHDPDSTECQEWRAMSKRLLAKVTEEAKP